MKAIIISLLVAFSILGLMNLGCAGNTTSEKTTQPVATTQSTANIQKLHDAMRMLWEDHIVYTRNFIISALAGLDDAKPVADRLMRNQEDIGNAIKPYYGNDAGDKLTTLLKEHIAIAGDIVMAAKKGDNTVVESGQKKWHDNADAIATFLSGANPNWTKAALTDLLNKHLEITTNEVVSRVKKDWAADIQAYDMGHAHMMMFADALTDGIVKQFPEKFKM